MNAFSWKYGITITSSHTLYVPFWFLNRDVRNWFQEFSSLLFFAIFFYITSCIKLRVNNNVMSFT